MDPLYHKSPPSTFLDLNEEQPQQDHLFNLNTQISSSLSLSPPLDLMINNPPQDHGEFFYKEPQRFQLQPPLEADHHKIFSSYGGSCDDHHPRVADQSESENSDDLKLTIWKKDVQDHTNDHKNHMNIMSSENFDDSVKWTSSKMRMMRKMIITNPDHQTISTNDPHNPINFTHKIDHQAMKNHTPTSPFGADHSTSSSSNNTTTNNNGTIRVCSDCNTTKTPLWRSGPRGPKSLCNACGIRQRKARRAMAAAAAAANGTIVAVDAAAASLKTSAKVKHKEKKTKVGGNGNCVNPQFKKRCKLTSPPSRGRKKLLCFEDLRISMSKSSAFNRVFPQDEKDAAILLMALSYGLVHG